MAGTPQGARALVSLLSFLFKAQDKGLSGSGEVLLVLKEGENLTLVHLVPSLKPKFPHVLGNCLESSPRLRSTNGSLRGTLVNWHHPLGPLASGSTVQLVYMN